MRSLLIAALALLLAGSMAPADPPPTSFELASPNGTLTAEVLLTEEGQPRYRVRAGDDRVVAASPLGFAFEDAPPMRDGFAVVDTARRAVDRTWTPVWGTAVEIANQFTELAVELRETEAPQRRVTLLFRAYDDGVAFRYRWPEQPNLDSLRIASEDTHFRFTTDHDAWWIPDDYDGYEWVYRQTPVSAIVDGAAALSYNSYLEEDDDGTPLDSTSKHDDPGAVNTPLTLRHPDGDRYVAVHEAALTDYAGMTL